VKDIPKEDEMEREVDKWERKRIYSSNWRSQRYNSE
jgi:hypothetical protein